MKKFILSILAIILISMFIFINLFKKQTLPSNMGLYSMPESSSEIANPITPEDIEDANKVISNYFNDLKSSETVILKDYLGHNMVQLSEIGACNINSENAALDYIYDDNFKPELIKIDNLLQHSFDPLSYIKEIKNFNNIDAYKVMALHVYFNYNKEFDWDFILVKYTESSPWKIHLWID